MAFPPFALTMTRHAQNFQKGRKKKKKGVFKGGEGGRGGGGGGGKRWAGFTHFLFHFVLPCENERREKWPDTPTSPSYLFFFAWRTTVAKRAKKKKKKGAKKKKERGGEGRTAFVIWSS